MTADNHTKSKKAYLVSLKHKLKKHLQLQSASANQVDGRWLNRFMAASTIILITASFYAYGGMVHVLNMLSLSGFNWHSAPIKWQALDVIYLILDVVVVVGLVARWKVGYVAFYVAAISQIFLYTVFLDWIVDVPTEFAVTDGQLSYLSMLVAFHSITLILVTAALKVENHR